MEPVPLQAPGDVPKRSAGAPAGRLRTSVGLRLLGVANVGVAVAVMAVSLTSAVGRGQVSGILPPAFLAAFTLLVGTRFALMPFLAWDDREVTVLNPFVKRTVPWSAIDEVLAGGTCLGFRLSSGRRSRPGAQPRGQGRAAAGGAAAER
jgi:hypothetical protein